MVDMIKVAREFYAMCGHFTLTILEQNIIDALRDEYMGRASLLIP